MSIEMKVEGLQELERTLGKLNGREVFRDFLKIGAEEIRSKAGEYPSETTANIEKPHGAWYERGSGTKYRRLDGSVNAYGNSQNLGKRWHIKSVGGSNPRAEIYNIASYAPYVHGVDQAWYHERTGWKRLEKVAEEELPKIVKKIRAQIDKLLR